MTELAEVRRLQLARLVSTRGFIRVTEASAHFAVSDVTIRGDLTDLEDRGLVVRVHGGAMPASAAQDAEQPLEASSDRDAAAKRAIGAAAAQLVSSGESVYIDAGSTALALAKALVARHELHDLVVVTSSISTALALEDAIPRFTVIVTGGTLRPLQHSLVNPFAAPMLDALTVDWAFIGCNGVDARAGVTNVNLPEAEIKTLVMRRSHRRVVIADASKIGVVELAVVTPIDSVETLVTTGGELAEIRAAGVEVIEAVGVAVSSTRVPTSQVR